MFQDTVSFDALSERRFYGSSRCFISTFAMLACAFGIISTLFVFAASLAQLQESEKIEQHLSFPGAFITRLDCTHNIRPFRRSTVDGLLSCGHACLKDDRCLSFNYKVSARRKGLCELNDAGISKDDELEKRPGFIYVQMTVDERVSGAATN